MPQGFLAQVRGIFEGDPGVRRVADDPALSAELLLLFRMILVDGDASPEELETFRRICRDSFAIPDDSIDDVIRYLNDFGYETTGTQAITIFRELESGRRRQLAQHLAAIAKADGRLAEREMLLLSRTLELLGLGPEDALPTAPSSNVPA